MKKNNTFLGFLTCMFLLNLVATVFTILGFTEGVLHSITIAILIVNVLMLMAAVWITGNDDGGEEGGS